MTPQLLAVLGACIMEIFAMFGSSSGCLKTGSAGAASLAEDLGQFKNILILAAAPLTQTFYAMIVLVTVFTIVLPKLATADLSLGGWVFGVTMITGFAELHSAYFQGWSALRVLHSCPSQRAPSLPVFCSWPLTSSLKALLAWFSPSYPLRCSN